MVLDYQRHTKGQITVNAEAVQSIVNDLDVEIMKKRLKDVLFASYYAKLRQDIAYDHA